MQQLTLKENKKCQREVEIAQLKRKRDHGLEVGQLLEVKMNHALYQAKLDQKKKCLQVLSQSHLCFNRFYEISGCEAFRLGSEQALLDPLQWSFSGPVDYDNLNRVKSNNSDLDYYATKENLGVDFIDELNEETET